MDAYFRPFTYNGLISVGYEFPFFKKSHKTSFTASIVCKQTAQILFFKSNFREPQKWRAQTVL